MSRPRSPFVSYNGKPWLVVNFDLEPADDRPLPELLDGLLEHHTSGEILLLRPLTKSEARLLKQATREAEIESWAQTVVKDDDRFRGRADTKSRR